MIHEVDKHIEGIYIEILRKMLEYPDKWVNYSEYNDRSWKSPYINEEEDIRFVSLSNVLTSTNYKQMEIYKDGQKIHELYIPWSDFKTRKLLRGLYDYKAKEADEVERKIIEDKSNLLKKSLGPRMERYIKLTKIRKKI